MSVRVTDGKNFAVDWGEGTNTLDMGTGSIVTVTSPVYGNTNDAVTITAADDCSLTILDISSCNVILIALIVVSSLGEINCNNNQLASLDLSNTVMRFLYCNGNQLTSIDNMAPANTPMQLWCSNNGIPLSVLYEINQKQISKYGNFNAKYGQ
jgi:hypothetical protein